MALVEVRNLTKVFGSGASIFGKNSGEVRAVDDVSLTIERGETLGLVGESGSGKSTLGRLVLRLIEPTSGEVFYEGKNILQASASEMRRLRRDMQIIFQDPFGSLDPRMRVRDVLAEPFQVHEKLSSAAGTREDFGTAAGRRPGCLRARALPARVQRRTAPAHRHRPRPRASAQAHRRRRTSLCPRRQRRRADRQPARAPPARVPAHLPLHLALHARRALSLYPNRGHAPRQTPRSRLTRNRSRPPRRTTTPATLLAATPGNRSRLVRRFLYGARRYYRSVIDYPVLESAPESNFRRDL